MSPVSPREPREPRELPPELARAAVTCIKAHPSSSVTVGHVDAPVEAIGSLMQTAGQPKRSQQLVRPPSSFIRRGGSGRTWSSNADVVAPPS